MGSHISLFLIFRKCPREFTKSAHFMSTRICHTKKHRDRLMFNACLYKVLNICSWIHLCHPRFSYVVDVKSNWQIFFFNLCKYLDFHQIVDQCATYAAVVSLGPLGCVILIQYWMIAARREEIPIINLTVHCAVYCSAWSEHQIIGSNRLCLFTETHYKSSADQ